MKKKKEGENFLKNFIQIQINEQKNQFKKLDYDLKIYNLCIEILEDYEYGDADFQLLVHVFTDTEN
jgi:hypothetical protein